MTTAELPFRATTEEACAWLAAQTGAPWTLARLIAEGVTPYVWLDYDAAMPELFGDANGGYAAPIFFEGDTARLAAGSDDVLITMTKDAYKIVARLPEPGLRRALHALRFQKKDLGQLVARLAREAAPMPTPAARESRAGISAADTVLVFGPLLKIDLDLALAQAGGVFGDDGARVKGSARKKGKALWNPVTLALGLNEVHRVPLGALKRAFASHPVLAPWAGDWNASLALLRK